MEDFFVTNPEKAAAKIQINNILMASCLAILTILWGIGDRPQDQGLLAQLVLSVPLLYVSSIAYTKIAYREEVKWWDRLGWFSGTTATIAILNAFGIMTSSAGYPSIAVIYFLLTWALLFVYTCINLRYHPRAVGVKVFKYGYVVTLQVLFGLVPVLLP